MDAEVFWRHFLNNNKEGFLKAEVLMLPWALQGWISLQAQGTAILAWTHVPNFLSIHSVLTLEILPHKQKIYQLLCSALSVTSKAVTNVTEKKQSGTGDTGT